MSEEHPNSSLIRDFHDHQNRFYAGGEQGPARAMLAEDAAWHVPGRSAIAGDYRGREEVLRYFAARRELANGTFRIAVRGVLADDERAVIFAGGQLRKSVPPSLARRMYGEPQVAGSGRLERPKRYWSYGSTQHSAILRNDAKDAGGFPLR